jgi:large subunit ribosomal protein L22
MKEEHKATARGFNLPISKKFSVEVASFIRGRNLKVAKKRLEGVLVKKVAVPMKRHNRDQGHKRGPMAAGRYPINATKAIIQLLNSAEMNALNKGLDVEALFVSSIIANKGSGAMRYGRQRGREAKRTHLEIVLEEREIKKKQKKEEKKPTEKKPEGDKK